MSDSSFTFPSVELTQEFVQTLDAEDAELSCVCIGVNYIVHDGTTEADRLSKNSAGDPFLYTGSADVTVKYPGHGLGLDSIVAGSTKIIVRNPSVSTGTAAAQIKTGKEIELGSAYISETADNSATETEATVKIIKDAKVTIDNVEYNLKGGDFYIVFKTLNKRYKNVVGKASDTAGVIAALGKPGVENPLGSAVYAAVSTAKGKIVYFTAVNADTTTEYNEALELLEGRKLYSVVPATNNADIIAAVLSDCVAQSDDADAPVYRVAWIGVDTPADAASQATKEGKIAKIVAQRTFSSYRAQAVWADGITFNGEVMPNYFGAAAAAGMRSYEPCHRPISNLTYTFFSVAEPNKFSRTQLKELGENGFWIIANNSNGNPCNLRQITSAMSGSLNTDEESIVANADNIAYALCEIGDQYIGCSNISDELLALLRGQIYDVLNKKLLNVTGTVTAGPQLVSWRLISLAQDTVNKDHVYAYIECEPPRPFNKFKMHVRII